MVLFFLNFLLLQLLFFWFFGFWFFNRFFWRGFSDNFLLFKEFWFVKEFLIPLLLLVDEMEYLICVVDAIEQLHGHALLDSSYKLPSLYKLSNSSLAIKPPRNAHLHRISYLLYLSQSIFIYHWLCLVDCWPWRHRGDGRLVFCVFEDQPDYCVYVSDCNVYFVREMQEVVEGVVDYYFGHGYFLRGVPEAWNLRASGPGDLVAACLLARLTYLRLFFLRGSQRHHLLLLLLILLNCPLYLSHFDAIFKVSQSNFVFCFLIVGKIVHEIPLKLFLQVFLPKQILYLLLQDHLLLRLDTPILAHALNHYSSIMLKRFFEYLMQSLGNALLHLHRLWQS